MKWAKTKSEISQIRKRLLKLRPGGGVKVTDGSTESITDDQFRSSIELEIKSNYEELDDKPTNLYLYKRKFGKWLVVPKCKIPANYKKARPRYEAFVGGFLYFFENHVSHRKNDNRVVYFDWGKINKDAGLTIFLSPLFLKHPVKVTDSIYSLYDDKNGDMYDILKSNGKHQYEQSETMQQVAIASQAEAVLDPLAAIAAAVAPPVDPPPPPPPPPPARE
jgi:hypothetical protein